MVVKLALLQHDDPLYQASITDVLQWLNEHFTNDVVRVRFARELEKLQAISIRSNFPDISLSFKMLKDIGKLRLEADKALHVETNSQVSE